MAKKKYVSISAILRCSQVSATTTFEKKDNIIKIDDIEIATENNTGIKPFSEDCQKGGCLSFGKGGKPCKPKLKKWKSEATKRKISGEYPLLENSTTECETIPGSKVVIEDPKQNTVFYDFEALMILEAIDKLNEMLAFRLNQYKDDPDKFNACLDKYFGEGHTLANKERLIERMRRTQNLLSDFKNADKTLNTKYFNYDNIFTGKAEGAYAYVYGSDVSNKVIYLNKEFFDNNLFHLNGFDSLPGTLAHEISHFDDIGNTLTSKGTDDFAYGAEAMDLVKNKEIDKAIDNADNFEFFLESGENCSTYH